MPFPDVVIGSSRHQRRRARQRRQGRLASEAIWVAISSGGDRIKALAMTTPDDPAVDDLSDGVTAMKLVQDLHIIPGLWKINGYSGLVARLQSALPLEQS
jgi:hypothetical protein